ncbi:MAG: phosphoglycerate mutase family protein [Candidatus Shapirobacteria bacterium]|nr:phosphoglycerate mutase family protein [Candidatus Shapirobacteria bacterium]MDD4410126.1 phosphoglycerate mutase family protein [Candidatus Shapirobacteria bacterium]
MKIILFRHGQKQKIDFIGDKKSLTCLNQEGIDQITKLGNILKTRFPELKSSQYLFTSSYARAIQSAEIVRSIIGIKEISIVFEFQEFFPIKDFSQPEEIKEHLYAQAMIDPDWIPPETNISFNTAISSFETKLREICITSSEETILISSHGGIIRNFVYSLEPKYRPSDDLIAGAKIHEGGYTVINYDGQNFSVDQFDVCDHLKN